MEPSYDWASATTSLVELNSGSLKELAAAANLDPANGDLIDIDLSGLDLRGQDMEGWDLRFANFDKAEVSGANLRGAKINPSELKRALGWQQAYLDDALRSAMDDVAISINPHGSINQLTNLPVTVIRKLKLGGIQTIVDLVGYGQGGVLRIKGIGRISLGKIENELARHGLSFMTNQSAYNSIEALLPYNVPSHHVMPELDLRIAYSYLKRHEYELAIISGFEAFESTLDKVVPVDHSSKDNVLARLHKQLYAASQSRYEESALLWVIQLYEHAKRKTYKGFTTHMVHSYLEDIEIISERLEYQVLNALS